MPFASYDMQCRHWLGPLLLRFACPLHVGVMGCLSEMGDCGHAQRPPGPVWERPEQGGKKAAAACKALLLVPALQLVPRPASDVCDRPPLS